MAAVLLETARLVLRGEEAGDLATWLAHMNTPAVMAHLGGVRDEAAVAGSFAGMGERSAEAPGFWFVALKDNGTLVGKAGASRIATQSAPAGLQAAL